MATPTLAKPHKERSVKTISHDRRKAVGSTHDARQVGTAEPHRGLRPRRCPTAIMTPKLAAKTTTIIKAARGIPMGWGNTEPKVARAGTWSSSGAPVPVVEAPHPPFTGVPHQSAHGGQVRADQIRIEVNGPPPRRAGSWRIRSSTSLSCARRFSSIGPTGCRTGSSSDVPKLCSGAVISVSWRVHRWRLVGRSVRNPTNSARRRKRKPMTYPPTALAPYDAA